MPSHHGGLYLEQRGFITFFIIIIIPGTGKETKTPIKPSIWIWETHSFAVHVSKLRLG